MGNGINQNSAYHSINDGQQDLLKSANLIAGQTQNQQTQQSYFQQKFQQYNCLPYLKCFNARNNKINSNWITYLKVVSKQKYSSYDWCTMLFTIALENKDQWKDEFNVKQVFKVAKVSIQEAEKTLSKDLSLEKLENMIDDVVDSTEILSESLSEYQSLYNKFNNKQSTNSNQSSNEIKKLSSTDQTHYITLTDNSSNNKVSVTKSEDKIKMNESMYVNLYQFHAVTQSIEDQLRDSQTVLFQIRKKYIDYFLVRYGNVKFNEQKQFTSVLQDIKGFVEFYIEIIRVYYRMDELVSSQPNVTFLTLENLQNFVVTILFDHTQFNQYLLNMYSQLDSELQKKYINNISQLQSSTPSQFGVGSQFCLDQNTLSHFKSSAQIKNGFQVPYSSLFKQFQLIEQIQSPTQKLKYLVKLSSKINECIKEFYQAHGLSGLEKPYDVDHLISLLIYIISHSSLTDLYSHLKVIQQFTSRNSVNSVSGYLLVTLEACFLHISQMKSFNQNQKLQIQETIVDLEDKYNQKSGNQSNSQSNVQEIQMMQINSKQENQGDELSQKQQQQQDP